LRRWVTRLWLDETAERYGSKSADPADLLTHVDIVPPSLAIAQAAEESGWGTSRFAREGNALFGQRAYKAHRKGIVPVERPEGTSFRVRAFDHLIDGVKSYMHNLNSHPAYRDFREARAKMRAEEGNIDGYDLAGALLRYSERGVAYVKTIRVIMRSNTLRAFDGARLGRSISPDA
jgi:Bax protein